jgi:hypothetical protein
MGVAGRREAVTAEHPSRRHLPAVGGSVADAIANADANAHEIGAPQSKQATDHPVITP